jgi:hypothetical protein
VSVRVTTLVWATKLSATEKLVLLALADFACDGGECWPSIATLCGKTELGERTVQRAVSALEQAGHLSRNQVLGKGCRYNIHPRHSGTPATAAPVPHRQEPPPQRHPTPATAAPKPSLNHQEPSRQTQRARAHIIPDGWQPLEFSLGSKCREIVEGWPPGELETQVEHFVSHHRGKGNRFVDWQDAWKTWTLNSRKWNNGNGNRTSARKHSGPSGAKGGIAAALDRRLGLDDPASPFGRRDAGEGAGHSQLILAAPRSVR